MPIGIKAKTVAGSFSASTTITEQGRAKAEIGKREEAGPFHPITFDKPHAEIVVGHTTNMSANYQSVTTKVEIHLPCLQEDIEHTKDRAWAMVEQFLLERAEWAKEVIEAYSEVRRKMEG